MIRTKYLTILHTECRESHWEVIFGKSNKKNRSKDKLQPIISAKASTPLLPHRNVVQTNTSAKRPQLSKKYYHLLTLFDHYHIMLLSDSIITTIPSIEFIYLFTSLRIKTTTKTKFNANKF